MKRGGAREEEGTLSSSLVTENTNSVLGGGGEEDRERLRTQEASTERENYTQTGLFSVIFAFEYFYSQALILFSIKVRLHY